MTVALFTAGAEPECIGMATGITLRMLGKRRPWVPMLVLVAAGFGADMTGCVLGRHWLWLWQDIGVIVVSAGLLAWAFRPQRGMRGR